MKKIEFHVTESLWADFDALAQLLGITASADAPDRVSAMVKNWAQLKAVALSDSLTKMGPDE